MAIAETAAALGSIKAAYDIAKGIQSLQTSTEVKQAVSDILDQLITARTDALGATEKESALLQEIRELKAQIGRLKAWDGEKERYELKRYQPGSLAYTLKPSMAGGEPSHHLCASCYQRGEKAILQATAETQFRWRVHFCPSCKTKTAMGSEMADQARVSDEMPSSPPPPYDRYAELDKD